jgi:BlaI family transcriptional regulator, penicillinase repressor
MVRPTAPGPTDHELTIMQLLWDQPSLTVNEILARFPREPKPAYTSLLTAVQGMEKKGLIVHQKDGKAYRYRAILQKTKFQKSALRRLLDSVFDNSPYDLAVNLLKDEKLDRDEILKLKQLLEKL